MTEPPQERPTRAPGLAATLGFDIPPADADRAYGRFEVTDAVLQPYGIVHGGAYAALSESVASHATHFQVEGEGLVAMGQQNDTSFLRPITAGVVHAHARCRHRGRTTWVWEVDITDDDDRLCAVSRVTIAVRPLPGPSA